jgi:hypothetical protein
VGGGGADDSMRVRQKSKNPVSGIGRGTECGCGNWGVTVLSIPNYCDRGSEVTGVPGVREDGTEVGHKMEAFPCVIRKARR